LGGLGKPRVTRSIETGWARIEGKEEGRSKGSAATNEKYEYKGERGETYWEEVQGALLPPLSFTIHDVLTVSSLQPPMAQSLLGKGEDRFSRRGKSSQLSTLFLPSFVHPLCR
jgi:hypothetical protein